MCPTRNAVLVNQLHMYDPRYEVSWLGVSLAMPKHIEESRGWMILGLF